MSMYYEWELFETVMLRMDVASELWGKQRWILLRSYEERKDGWCKQKKDK